MKRIHIAMLPLLALALTSCDFSFSFSFLPVGSSSSEYSYSQDTYPSLSISMSEQGDGYYRPATVNDNINFYKIGQCNGDALVPSVGKFHLLVLPIEFSDCPFGKDRLADIRTAFSGSSAETQYWESLKSYYEKSSYGQLEFEFTFADPCVLGTTPMEWFAQNKNKIAKGTTRYSDAPEAIPQLAMQEAVVAYRNSTGDDCKRFDHDGDGYIDACLMVYSCHDKNATRSTASPYYHELKNKEYGDLFWAYQYSDQSDPVGSPNSPVGNRYFWASYDFFYEGVREDFGVDAHTLIHETGHILGTDDYYNYADGETSNPSGSLMMMSSNVLDHDAFTKMCFGWVSPYVVTDNTEITIRPFESSGECILLADSWNGTSFDEYVMFELYTPTGLNQLDAKNTYSGGTRGYSHPGVIAYHIDSRLVKTRDFSSDGVPQVGKKDGFLTDEEVQNFDAAARKAKAAGYFIVPGITNTAAYDASSIQGKGYELIQLIQSSGRNTLRRGGDATDSDLFHKGDSFSINTHYAFFPEAPNMNNGKRLPYEVSFKEVNGEYATLVFTKKA